MAVFDLRLKLYIAGAAFGVGLTILALVGELLGWWNDFGVVLAMVGMILTVALGFIGASRFQVRALGSEIRGVRADTTDIKASSARIESNTQRIESNTQRIEANTQRIEANTQGIAANTEGLPRMEALLREIRDRLPPAG